ncbi:pyridoxamine 5'-phosphate oxidase [Hyphococcus lacteus]|uniref:Pyridoxine/pyridoxamine 5'-phosphate oxidase n=1 Tax=Hyphococcus lacteus TaxID=3143536 RepID=A0ABV3Z797_9PROT
MSDLIPPSPSTEAYSAEADQGDVFSISDPTALFAEWLGLARENEMNDPNAMALATVDKSGMPDVRMVLLKDFDACGLTFFTNTESAKGEQLAATPNAAICFHWKSIRRQVRFRGTVSPVTKVEADSYFAKRARGAQLGAHASAQSRILEEPKRLKRDIDKLDNELKGRDVPRPEHWSGYRLLPLEIEFWVNRPFRLHDRLRYIRPDGKSDWKTERLYP